MIHFGSISYVSTAHPSKSRNLLSHGERKTEHLFSWPRTRDAASHQLDRPRCERFPGEVSPPAVLKVNPRALDWRPRPRFRARMVSRGASGVLEWTSKA